MRGIEDGVIDRHGVAGLARELAVSPRHLQRIMTEQVGAGPKSLARARRARAARALIETSPLQFTDIAFATGFNSVRQFNDTIRDVFALSPTEMRERRGRRTPDETGEWLAVMLPFRAPLAVPELLRWLRLHAVVGVEEVEGSLYRRSIRLEGGPAVAEVDFAGGTGSALPVRFRLASMADLPRAINRMRRLLDLDADPAVIAADLGTDPLLAELIGRTPGLRSPGEVSGTDAAVRSVLHQQVSLASAKAMAARLVAAHGIELSEPVGGVRYAFPNAATWAKLDPDELGLPKSRAAALVRVAQAIASGDVDLSPWANRADAVASLLDLKGIGPWTANVVAAKALASPDAFGAGDLALLRVAAKLGLPETEKLLDSYAERWRPWRSYAMHHLWNLYLNELESEKDPQ